MNKCYILGTVANVKYFPTVFLSPMRVCITSAQISLTLEGLFCWFSDCVAYISHPSNNDHLRKVTDKTNQMVFNKKEKDPWGI